jgi:hypothetical protein
MRGCPPHCFFATKKDPRLVRDLTTAIVSGAAVSTSTGMLPDFGLNRRLSSKIGTFEIRRG